ncbi:hypothetical protein [Microbacterium lacticum]|uniref:hypothetical protein n=1 Tax=Microbacterium lacticum TaxID=33885 RepID=UPI0028D73FB5|nr:hypothetical protein [Microbacterium lacticum]
MTGSQPQRRKSSLTGKSFFQAHAEAEAQAQAEAQEPVQAPAPVAPVAAPEPVKSAAGAPKRKVSYYADDDENGRIRAAFMAGRDRYGWRSFTDFQLATILDRVEQLEQELNGGRPFEGVPPKGGQLGRPMS